MQRVIYVTVQANVTMNMSLWREYNFNNKHPTMNRTGWSAIHVVLGAANLWIFADVTSAGQWTARTHSSQSLYTESKRPMVSPQCLQPEADPRMESLPAGEVALRLACDRLKDCALSMAVSFALFPFVTCNKTAGLEGAQDT